MYSIEINFLKDRVSAPVKGGRTRKALPKGAQTPMYAGILIGLLFPALALAFWAYIGWRTEQVQKDIDTKNVELAQLQEKQKQIDSLKAEIAIARSQVDGLAGVFGRVKSWAALLQDLRDRTPANVKISSIEQLEVTATPQAQPSPTPAASPNAAAPNPVAAAPPQGIPLKITGIANAYPPVNDFLLMLKNSPMLDPNETRLVKAEISDFPGTVQQTGKTQVQVELPKVVKYEIETQLTALADEELLRFLERKGALGLATRLRAAERLKATRAPAAKPK